MTDSELIRGCIHIVPMRHGYDIIDPKDPECKEG